MLSRRVPLIAALAALAVAFGWGIVVLFQLRFAGGDVYPEYSSLRADPLGTKVYYEALGNVGQQEIQRNLRGPHHLPEGRETALFVFGLPWDELEADDSEYRQLDAFVRGGGRLVVTLYPELSMPRNWGAGTNRIGLRQSLSAEAPPAVDLQKKWGFALGFTPFKRSAAERSASAPARPLAPEILSSGISWHSALVFTNLSFDWHVIYARGTDAVMIERRFGAGTIVLATDSYFVSNEALQKERSPALLAWLVGASRTVVFDEVHLGVHEQPGVAALARRYNLHGALAVLLLIALLFVWKNALSFVPRPAREQSAVSVAGRESAAGFVNLLRRSIVPDQLLQVCLTEWHKTRQLDSRASPRRVEEVRAAVATHNSAAEPNPVATYNEISRILNKK